jgi:predicted nucleotidyltransferase
MEKTPLGLPTDFVDLLTELERSGVRYVVLGGYAVGFHDRPRTTKDLDLLIDSTPRNVERAAQALSAFGAPRSVLQAFRAAADDEVVWMGVPPVRIDLLRTADGIEFRSCYPRRQRVRVGALEVSVIGLDDLIANKRAADRPQDRADVLRLLRVRARQAGGRSVAVRRATKGSGRRARR